jgi:PAS domain S-box-containing protein
LQGDIYGGKRFQACCGWRPAHWTGPPDAQERETSALAGELRRSQQALRESEGRLRAILETAVDGILTLDERGLVTSFNPAAARLFGYSPEEVIGRSADALLAAPGPAEHDGAPGTSGGGPGTFGRRKDGTAFPMDLAVGETRLEEGRILTWIVRDVGERKQAEEQQAKLAAIVESSDDAIVSKTLGGIITTWNRGAERLFGYRAEEIVGRSVLTLLPQDRHGEEAAILERLRRGERVEHFETVRIAKGGRHIDVSLTISPIKDARGRIVGASKITRDISDRKRVASALAQQAEELARSNVELERFAYVASHDLQEPLRTIGRFAQLLQRRAAGALTEEAQEYLRYVTDGVQRMQNLINDVLAYSRVGSQGAAFAPADCNVILAKVTESLKASIEGQHAEVTADPLPVVVGDATQLGQVFQNLLANALKFHGERPPRIRISASERGGEWVFSVSDNGIGIAPEYLERIFIVFQRLHTLEEYPGTGMGLGICKKIVERHGGWIWAESAVGQGSTFRFTLPRRTR